MTNTAPDAISDLVAALPGFLGEHTANSFVAVAVDQPELDVVIRADLLDLLSDAALALRYTEAMSRHLSGRKIVFLAITDLGNDGTLAIDKMRRLTLPFNVTDAAVVRTSEYARDNGRGPRLPLVQSRPIGPIQAGSTNQSQGIYVTRS